MRLCNSRRMNILIRVLIFPFILTILSFPSSAEPREITVDEVRFDLGTVARSIATYKSCIHALDDKGEEDMAIFFSEAFIKRMYLFKKLKPEDREFVTQTARFFAMELDKITFQKTKVVCRYTYEMAIELE